jgi:hypothetical protein
MLAERVATRVAAGPLWPMQAEPAWRDGNVIHVGQQHGDHVVIHGPNTFTNLAEMAANRPPLPGTLPPDVAQRVAVFDSLLARADTEPYQVVEAAWPPLRAIVVEVYEQRVGPMPMPGFKVVDMVTHMADEGLWNLAGSTSPTRSTTGRSTSHPRRCRQSPVPRKPTSLWQSPSQPLSCSRPATWHRARQDDPVAFSTGRTLPDAVPGCCTKGCSGWGSVMARAAGSRRPGLWRAGELAGRRPASGPKQP